MTVRVILVRDFDQMSEVSAEYAVQSMQEVLQEKDELVLGLATGNSPTGLYKHLAKAFNAGLVDATRIRSFNLDEYVGLPGASPQDRVMHPESYSWFMIQELFALMTPKFRSSVVPPGTMIDQDRLIQELAENPGDWEERGQDKGRSIAIRPQTRSSYLGWVAALLGNYDYRINQAKGIDLQVVGVGGRGHVAFHECGIPFAGSRVMLVKLDDDTVTNAVADGHFTSVEESPRYATSMGAELVFQARRVLLLASGARKAAPMAEALLGGVNRAVPVSLGQLIAGEMVCVLDQAAGADLIGHVDRLAAKGIQFEDRTGEPTKVTVESIEFHRDPDKGVLV